MDLLRLACSLLLPWFLGYLIVRGSQSSLANSVSSNHCRNLGFGFFIGYFLLYLLIRFNLTISGELQYGLVIGLLCLLLLPSAWLAFNTQKRKAANPGLISLHQTCSPSRLQQWAIFALLLMIALHWAFALMETLLRPLFPWDAFTTWSYAAKAWFYGGYSEFIPPEEWLRNPDASQFTSHVHQYPIFSSLVQLWTATSLGRWSETLINLPSFLAGTAIGLALYGESRAQGLSTLPALLICYLFFSIPLVNTHLSLGGYADIWLAGYTGLGFVALISGVAKGERFTIMLGLALTGFGALVKFEGAVWFLTALAFLSFHWMGLKRSTLLLLVASALAGGAYLFNLTLIELPIIGLVGVSEGNLYLPGIGLIKLQYHNVWEPYLQNFFMLGSWNLLWSALLLSVLGCFFFQGETRTRREHGAALLFLFLFVTSQFVIFFLTDQGRWAEKFTSINRLPLQFTPALVFTLVIIWKSKLITPQSQGREDE